MIMEEENLSMAMKGINYTDEPWWREEFEVVKLVSVVIINVTIWLKDVKGINFHVYLLCPAELSVRASNLMNNVLPPMLFTKWYRTLIGGGRRWRRMIGGQWWWLSSPVRWSGLKVVVGDGGIWREGEGRIKSHRRERELRSGILDWNSIFFFWVATLQEYFIIFFTCWRVYKDGMPRIVVHLSPLLLFCVSMKQPKYLIILKNNCPSMHNSIDRDIEI